MKHANIAIFVPHAGCPHQCSFCDQRFISGRSLPPTETEIQAIVECAIKSLPESAKPAQIAFFGGSFTAIDRQYMVSLLQCVQTYINGTTISGIRVSTRPDAISDEILKLLMQYQVTDIELGAQSMDNTVLQSNLRGHTSEDIAAAAQRIQSKGFRLGLQIMTGLYIDSMDTTHKTARRVAELKPDYVRIYPALVLKGTMLHKIYENGDYKPQALEEAVELCAELLTFFIEKGIPVIRLGLHDSPDLLENYIAGPYHPAFRELCESRIMLKKAFLDIEEKRIPKGNISIFTAPFCVSRMAGQKRANLLELERMGYRAKMIQDDSMNYLEVKALQRM